jgi:hypothetical protein
VCKRKAHLTFLLDGLLYLLLRYVFLHLSFHNSLNLYNAWTVRIPHCTLYQVPHALAFLSVAFLLDCRNSCMLVLGLGLDQAVAQVDFAEPLCLFAQICFAYACKLKPVLKSIHCESFGLLDVLPMSKLQSVAASHVSCFTFF